MVQRQAWRSTRGVNARGRSASGPSWQGCRGYPRGAVQHQHQSAGQTDQQQASMMRPWCAKRFCGFLRNRLRWESQKAPNSKGNRVSERATCKTGSSAPGTRSASGFPTAADRRKTSDKGHPRPPDGDRPATASSVVVRGKDSSWVLQLPGGSARGEQVYNAVRVMKELSIRLLMNRP